jgi:hypothetical protein
MSYFVADAELNRRMTRFAKVRRRVKFAQCPFLLAGGDHAWVPRKPAELIAMSIPLDVGKGGTQTITMVKTA